MRIRNSAVAARYIAAVLATTFSLLFAGSVPAQEFSWDHVPLYAEIGKTEGDFTPAEVKFLASHFDIITVEKAQALKQRGSSEAGNKVAVAQLKAANPKLKVILYWSAYVDRERMYRSLQRQMPDDWFLSDEVGQPTEGPWRRFDTSNPAFQRWWVDTAAQLVRSVGADGIFVDELPHIAGHPKQLAEQAGSARAAAMIDGVQQMLKDLRAKLGSGSIIIFNGLRSMPNGWPDGGAQFLRYASGALMEDFATKQNASKEMILSDMDLIKRTEAAGKIVLVKGWPTTERVGPRHPVDVAKISADADRALSFPLACFLAVASDHAYFSYSWGFRAENGWFRTYDAFEHRLGPPLGPASRTGWRFERKFTHADVSVDLAARTADINWR